MTGTHDDLLADAVDQASTIDLHRSNLLRMQVKELLDECMLDLESAKWTSHANEYLQLLTRTIRNTAFVEEGFQEQADKPVSVEIEAKGLTALSVEPIGGTKNRFGFTKKGGNAHVLPTFELAVKIPEAVFAKKDFMNFRYFDKRNLISKRVAEQLQKTPNIGDVQFVWTKGHSCPPLLRLSPTTKKQKRFQVDLHVGMESIDWIPRLRLVPNRQNIKKGEYSSQSYNHSLLYDSRHSFQDSELADIQESQSFQEAIALVQVWALQRGLWRNHDGWDLTSVGLFVVYLLRTRKINPRMTNLQVFTVVLQSWATTNWLGQEEIEETNVRASTGEGQGLRRRILDRCVIVLPKHGRTEAQTRNESEIARVYEQQTKESPLSKQDAPNLIKCYARQDTYLLGPVFLDPTMTYNYLGSVSPNYCRLLQTHAAKSLEALQQPRTAFDYLFMKPVRFFQQWDMYFQIQVGASRIEDWELGARQLVDKLEAGLGNRITNLRVLSTGNADLASAKSNTDQYPKISVKDMKFEARSFSKSPTGTLSIVVGVGINPETCQRVVDRGPPAEETEAVKKFTQLWGKRAQLRRFKDGAVVPAIVWNDGDEPQAHQYKNAGRWNGGFVAKIVKHLTALHYTKEAVVVSLPHLLSAIDVVDLPQNTSLDPWSAHNRAVKSFEALSDILRNSKAIHDQGLLPIEIDAVEALTPFLRHSALFPPVEHPALGAAAQTDKKQSGAIISEPLLIQIKLRSSSKWPTDLKAIGAAKTGMLIQLAKSIENAKLPGFDGRVTVSPSAIQFGYNGYCFRLRVKAEPEILMLKKLESPSQDARNVLAMLTRDHIIEARHHKMIQALHTQYPTASAVVRLAKRWIASHLLSGHFSGDIIELLVAKVYSRGEAVLDAPVTAAAGFGEFLRLLANYDWKNSPLLVDPRGVLTDEEFHEISGTFEKIRGPTKEAGPALFIVSPYNGRGMNWDATTEVDEMDEVIDKWQPSIESPEWVVVTRAATIAKASYDFMQACISTFEDKHWGEMFIESPASLQSHSILFRVGTDLILEKSSSSMHDNFSSPHVDVSSDTPFSQSMKARKQGPAILRSKVYRNLHLTSRPDILTGWQPVSQLVNKLQRSFGKYALFFYNQYCPEAIGLVWRPNVFSAVSFSALSSEHVCPEADKPNLVVKSVSDILREMKQVTKHVVTEMRMFDGDEENRRAKRRRIASETSAASDDW